jgi:PAS domain S-box-containing protein
MSEALRNAPKPRPRIPLWDDYNQAERFAAILAISALFAVIPYVLAQRMIVAGLCVALAGVVLALCVWSARGGPAEALGYGTPLAMTVTGLALLYVTGGTCVASATLLAFAPAVAVLWSGSKRAPWVFLTAALLGAAAAISLVPEVALSGAEPWIADARAPWITPLLAIPLFFLARSWTRAHASWQEEVIAAHAVVAASEARFKAYVENAHDVLAELDGRGRVLFVTAKREEHYALPVAELLGTTGGDYLHADDLPAARSVFEKAAAGRAAVSGPLRYRGRRGGWRYMRVAVSAYRTREGKLRFVAQVRDETAVVEAHRERDRLVAQLEAALAQSQALLAASTCPHCGERASTPS